MNWAAVIGGFIFACVVTFIAVANTWDSMSPQT